MSSARASFFVTAVVVGAVLLATARPAQADSLRLDPGLDGALLGSGAVLGVMLEVLAQSGELTPGAPGRVDDINPLDRWVAEGSSRGTDTAHDVSNVLLGVSYAAALAASLLRGTSSGAAAGWTDLALYAEALAWNAVIANVVKLAVRRPRPISYIQVVEGTFDPDETDGTLSFYSGHTSTVASVAATATTIEFLRAPCGSARPWLVLAGGAAATVATGALRVAAKRHFVTDVSVGAVMGTAIGVTVPLLHRQGLRFAPTVERVRGGATVGVAGAL